MNATFFRKIALTLAALSLYMFCHAYTPLNFHCEKDTAAINELLFTISDKHSDSNSSVLAIAESFIGKPASAPEYGIPELLEINIDTFNPTSFVETIIALAKTANSATPTWRKFSENLENLRYRRGEMTDFTSRLLYNSEWITENIYRGNIKELTNSLPGAKQTTRSLDYVTRNIEQFPPLKDSVLYDRQKMLEWGLRSYAIPYLPKESIASKKVIKELMDGDVIVLLSTNQRTDMSDVGIIKIIDGKVHIIHISLKEQAVVLEKEPLIDWFKHEGRSTPGYRVLRIE